MSAFLPEIDQPFTVHGIHIVPNDTQEQYLQKIARIALDEMREAVGVLTPDGIVLDCNRSLLERGGLTRDEVIGKPFAEIHWPNITIKVREELRGAIGRAAKGEFVRYQVEALAQDFTLRPIKDKRGSVVFLQLEGRNVTEPAPTADSTVTTNLVNVRGTELLASDTRERYRQKIARITLDSMVQFVGLLDAKGTVLEINQVALDAVGIKLSESKGSRSGPPSGGRSRRRSTRPSESRSGAPRKANSFAGMRKSTDAPAARRRSSSTPRSCR